MKNKWVISIHAFLVLAATWGLGYSQALGKTLSQPAAAGNNPAEVESIVNNAINFQGALKESGLPVSGTRSITFELFNTSNCTGGILSTYGPVDVTVTNGLFNVALPFDYTFYNGQALGIRASVYSTVVGCQELRPTPYALSLRPGAIMWANTNDYLLKLTNDGDFDTSGGLYAKTNSDWHAAAVLGEGTTTRSYGVYGKNTGGGYAIYSDGKIWGSGVTTLKLSPFSLMLRDNSGLTFEPQADGSNRIRASGPGSGIVVVPISTFNEWLGSKIYFESIEVCYYVNFGKIAAIQLVKGNFDVGYDLYINDTVEHDDIWPECVTKSADYPHIVFDASSYLQFNLSYTQAGYVAIGEITLTLTDY